MGEEGCRDVCEMSKECGCFEHVGLWGSCKMIHWDKCKVYSERQLEAEKDAKTKTTAEKTSSAQTTQAQSAQTRRLQSADTGSADTANNQNGQNAQQNDEQKATGL